MGVVLYAFTRNVLAVVFIALSPVLMIGTYIDQQARDAADQMKDADKQFAVARLTSRQAARAPGAIQRAVRLERVALGGRGLEVGRTRLGQLLWTHRPEHGAFVSVRLGLGTAHSRDSVTLPHGQRHPSRVLGAARRRCREVSRSSTTCRSWPTCARSGSPRRGRSAWSCSGVTRGVVAQLAALHSPAELVVDGPRLRPHRARAGSGSNGCRTAGSPHSPLGGDHLADNPGSASPCCRGLETRGSAHARGRPAEPRELGVRPKRR